MSSELTQSGPETLRNWIDQLACPACLNALTFAASGAVCTACRRCYPILDGIPILIIEKAVDEPRVPPAPDREFQP
ncbi:MAG TPA: hypothetical protein VIY99_00315 [Terracidiphilus sp.]